MSEPVLSVRGLTVAFPQRRRTLTAYFAAMNFMCTWLSGDTGISSSLFMA